MTAGMVYKLRDEGKKKQRGLGIQHLGHNALPERILGNRECSGKGFVPPGIVPVRINDHAYTEKTEIRSAHIFHGGKS